MLFGGPPVPSVAVRVLIDMLRPDASAGAAHFAALHPFGRNVPLESTYMWHMCVCSRCSAARTQRCLCCALMPRSCPPQAHPLYCSLA